MASFVPDGLLASTPYFTHDLIPPGSGHAKLPCTKTAGASRAPAGGPAAGGTLERTRLMDFLAAEWDYVRQLNEKPSGAATPTVAAPGLNIDDRYFTVSGAAAPSRLSLANLLPTYLEL